MRKYEARSKIKEYIGQMEKDELSERTINKYVADIKQWIDFNGDEINFDYMKRYKKYLVERYSVSSINSKLISVNRYLKWLGHSELTLRTKRFQRSSSLEHMVSKADYMKMLEFAKKTNRLKMFYIMRTIATTGIRIGELKYITVEAVEEGSVEVYNKGKYRRIYFSHNLCKELNEYCKNERIMSGIVFLGRNKNKCISSSAVWKNLKYIASQVGIPEGNVYPHSFRHLFARIYMDKIGDITELSDLLGHSRLETTWIYTKTTAEEKRERLDKMSL
ncbi:tyrosine-type recombinase/integrase [Zhenpiania hominis]|uniref:tyrosine-type recombinase/integrase n=1 Tax=Zhenpiania hominis TaxID=2763644 RepID=UPI0039F526A2